jgi:hypothetical protein
VIRKLTDSGSSRPRTPASKSGRTPPIWNRACQPKASMRRDASSPARAPPIGNPAHSNPTTALRFARGTNSEAKLMKLGIAPPRPTPAQNRYSRSCSTDVASAVQSVKTPKVMVAPIRARLRPSRSANGPKPNAPTISPSSAILKTSPSLPGAICSAAAMLGPATPIARRSKPSSSATRPHNTTIVI